ncbi:MAG: uracil-DNA glycosylase, partial [Gammaproteobacteria bacterium]|nr:uracil-DNA glycosylase [Gammaproteobacteria bacterium]
KCLPPENKPSGSEVRTCNPYLKTEIAAVGAPGVVLTLGRIAHEAVLLAGDRRRADFPFGHGAWHQLSDDLFLCNSYHTSKYNIYTKRLTTSMFENIIAAIQEHLVMGHGRI